jgi:hypothetical protein
MYTLMMEGFCPIQVLLSDTYEQKEDIEKWRNMGQSFV